MKTLLELMKTGLHAGESQYWEEPVPMEEF